MTVFNEYAATGHPIAAGVKLTKQFIANVAKIPCTYDFKGLKWVPPRPFIAPGCGPIHLIVADRTATVGNRVQLHPIAPYCP
jgi:hypothetical protein